MSSIPTTSLKAAGGNIAATAAVANAAAAGTITAMSLQWNPRITATIEVIIPTAEVWMLIDCYAASSADAGVETNPQIEVKKDNDRLLDTTNRLSSVILTSQQRPNGLHGNLLFEGGSHMTMNLITSKVATAARSIEAIFPYEKQG